MEMFITHKSWRKYMACLEGPHKEVKADREIERERSWGMYLYLKSIGGVLWGSQAGIGFNSNQERRVFISPPGVLSKGCISHTGARRRGRLLITSAVGEVLSGTHICL